jgi:hypothetical protein
VIKELARVLCKPIATSDRMLPYFDSLRGDSRFEKIVASLAPKQ